MLNADKIRRAFLDFFKSKKHTVVDSDSLVPKDDPTVLFTTAGMQQFKRQFLGHIEGYTRAATSQKCLRTDDLDKVGQTAFHHTFFEMLGNFSFGDYFKEDAIAWGWEFLTEVLNMPKDKLWVSIYKDDSEAETIWLESIKIPKTKLVKLGDKSNFWPANAKQDGPNGPCGPCSEIFYDYGVNPNCTRKTCDPDCDCGRFSEIWNLVFTQFNRKDGGVLEPLPSKNIDTGMGLERLVAVLEKKKSNFETDLFTPILDQIHSQAKKQNIEIHDTESRIIADHIRAVVFAIADGVIPSNKERGSVIKRLITNSADIILRRHGKPFLQSLVPVVIDIMKHPYPELGQKSKEILLYIEKTQSDYEKVFELRIPEFLAQAEKAKDAKALGRLCFTFYDTYGLTLSTIWLSMDKLGINKKMKEDAKKAFHNLLNEQQNRSRASSKMAGDVFVDTELDFNVAKTKFIGYEKHSGTGKILKMYKDNTAIEKAQKGETIKLVLDKTCFYAESGGQIGDTGIMTTKTSEVRITDTQKRDDIFIHFGEVSKGSIKTNDKVEYHIDEDRRLSIMRNHTATHILQAALRNILGTHVQQQGSLVAEDRLRFDFTHPKAVTDEQIRQIENYVNQRILASDIVTKEVLPAEKAKKSGALAYFAEKYGSTVRVVTIDDFSKEFCGGTHLNSTGQIGLFKITEEHAIAQGIRRIEAKTGSGALEMISEKEKQINRIAQIMKAPEDEIVSRLEAQTKKIKILEKELEQYRLNTIKNSVDEIVDKAASVNQAKIIVHCFDGLEMNMLRNVSDLIKQKAKSCVIVLGSVTDGNGYLLTVVTDNLFKEGFDAKALVEHLAPRFNGSGGGKPHFAQAGSKDPGKLKETVKETVVLKVIDEIRKDK